LQDKLSPFGIAVKAFHSHIRPCLDEIVDVAICTPEKANGIILNLIDEGNLDALGIVVVDEIHIIGDESRGILVEMLLSKLVRAGSIHTQLVGMSATLSNVEHLSKWLNAKLYVSSFRPLPLKQYYTIGPDVFEANTKTKRRTLSTATNKCLSDADILLELCKETLLKGRSVLVFAPTRDWCSNCCKLLSDRLLEDPIPCSSQETQKRTSLTLELTKLPGGPCRILEKAILQGVGYHHAGLTTLERSIIEVFH
jgi:DNA polymerase theta